MNANSYNNPGIAGGNREDLRDILTILEPEETPFVSVVPKGEAPKATFVECLADVLRKPRTAGTREGLDAGKAGNKVSKRQRFGVYVHRSQDEYGVTDVQQAVSKRGGVAAVSNEYANSKAKCVREVKRDIEAVCCSSLETQGGSDTDMQTRGALTWLSLTAQAVAPVPADFRPLTAQKLIVTAPANTDAMFTEDSFNQTLKALNKVYGAKREFQLIAGVDIVETVDNFSRIVPSGKTRYLVNDEAARHAITLMVQLYESSFGRVNVVPTQFNGVSATTGDGDPKIGLILNTELWEMDFLEDLHAVDQDENAGGESGYVKAMFALLCKNPKGNGFASI